MPGISDVMPRSEKDEDCCINNNTKNVFFVLAGGPGGTQMAATRYELGELEKHFVVVSWDQPGSALGIFLINEKQEYYASFIGTGQMVDFEETVMTRVYYALYVSSTKRTFPTTREGKHMWRNVKKEYQSIIRRAPFIGKRNRLEGAYTMAAYFITLNRNNHFSLEENYQFFSEGLKQNKLFRLFCGTAEKYLDE